VRGVREAGTLAWKGIPYAAAPVGSLRWRAPRAVVPWQGTRDATRFGPACMQTDPVPKSEDCLTLNVWRPVDAPGPVPVMVWIHGGAMVHGSSALYPGAALANKGVVVVTINFRLGRLGYFAHPALTAEAPDEPSGNFGYLDQRAALQWVQRNVKAFGGDPSQVTIFGESAGGGSVLAHLVSPMSRGLFHRAILQSPGTPAARAASLPYSDLPAAERIAAAWAKSVGAENLAQLRKLPADAVVAGTGSKETLALLALGRKPAGMAMMIVDGQFLVETPEAALAAGRQAMVPVMVGANDRDLPVGVASSKDDLFALFGPDAAVARHAYDPLGSQTLDELKQQVFADRTLVEPARHLANEMARTGQQVWLYRFAYVSEAQRGQNMGTLHGFEIPFTLDVPAALVGDKVTPTDRVTADTVSTYWANFGKSGDPNGTGSAAWPRHDPLTDQLMHFTNSGPILGTDPLRERLDLWQRAYESKR